jgi:hypothetical protein
MMKFYKRHISTFLLGIIVLFYSSNSFGFGSNQSIASVDINFQIAENALLNSNPWLLNNQNQFKLESSQTSQFAQHFQFVQFHQGIKVYGAFFKVNIAFDGKILSFFNSFKPVFELQPLNGIFVKDECRFFESNNQFYLLKYSLGKNSKGEVFEYLTDATGKLYHSRMLDLKVKKDTIISTQVFNPDPLTSAQKTYGQDGLWNHANGANTAELNSQLKSMSTTLTFQNDTFFPTSPYIVIQDLESPSQTIFTSKSANFSFNRAQSEFREFNVLYHIEVLRKYLKSIQVPLTNMPAILADPTAYAGQDQSRFSYSMSDPSLYFGTGGVPDAEDADVIVHEYSHGINYFLAPNTVDGGERLAIEEANCDFMACQYSKSISNFNWKWVFNWDGHNDFWAGRDANSPNTYPKDLSTDFYTSSLIWSSMLNDLSEDLGRDIITRILLNSISSYANFMSMQDAANLLIQSDSMIYGYAHFNILKPRLVQRGFIVTGVESHQKLSSNIELINSQGFANGNANLIVQNSLNQKMKWEIRDINGNLILVSTEDKPTHQISPEQFSFGMYFITITAENGSVANAKLLRLN